MKYGCTAGRLPLLGVPVVLLFAPFLSAQSPDNPPNCPLTPGQQALLRHFSHQDERPRVILGAITFDGQISLTEEQRQKLAANIRHEEFFAGTDWENRAESLARAVWQDQGYYRVSVRAASEPVRREGKQFHYNLNFEIEEGAQYRLGELRLKNANPEVPSLAFPPEQLRQLIPIKEGDVFSAEKLRSGLEALRNLYARHGYMEFTAQPITDPDPEHQLVSLTLELDEEAQYRVGRVYILGADTQMEALLRSSLIPGEVFNDQILPDFFKANEQRLPPDAARRRVTLVRDPILPTVTLHIDLRPCPDPEF